MLGQEQKPTLNNQTFVERKGELCFANHYWTFITVDSRLEV